MQRHEHKTHWQLALRVGSVVLGLGIVFPIVDGGLQRKRLVEARAAHMSQEIQLLSMAIEQ